MDLAPIGVYPTRILMDLRYIIGAAAAAVFVAMPVFAADNSSSSDSRSRADRAFERLDKNHDGSIDQSEAQQRPWLQQSFSQYDGNHDGKLGKDEFAQAASAQRSARDDRSGASGADRRDDREFERLDKNHDGSIDQSEVKGTDHEQ